MGATAFTPQPVGPQASPVADHQSLGEQDAAIRIRFESADIRGSAEWAIRSAGDTMIVHLAGRMDTLETEIDGRASSRGSAVVGEVWTVPAGVDYRSQARGGTIAFAVLTSSTPSTLCAAGSQLSVRAGYWDGPLLAKLKHLETARKPGDDANMLDASAVCESIQQHVLTTYGHAVHARAHDDACVLTPADAALLRDFIHDNLGNRIALDQLAALVGRTSHQFLTAFRQAFGTTPGQHIIAQRVREAQRQLLHTSRDVSTIALRCGFSSHSHLSSTFSKRLATTPTAFRQRYR